MSKLLLNEQPLLIMPQLAEKIGLNESIVIQQIHYWNVINEKANNNFKDGHYWTFNSYVQWKEQFPFWSESTIKRIIKSLEKMGLVIIGNYNKLKIDRTNWYRIDYEMLATIENTPKCQIELIKVSNRPNQDSKLKQPLPEINSKTISKNNYTPQQVAAALFEDIQEKEMFMNINNYCIDRFDKPIRQPNKRCYQFETLAYVEEDSLYNILDTLTYDQCNLDYLEVIQDRYR